MCLPPLHIPPHHPSSQNSSKFRPENTSIFQARIWQLESKDTLKNSKSKDSLKIRRQWEKRSCLSLGSILLDPSAYEPGYLRKESNMQENNPPKHRGMHCGELPWTVLASLLFLVCLKCTIPVSWNRRWMKAKQSPDLIKDGSGDSTLSSQLQTTAFWLWKSSVCQGSCISDQQCLL